MRHYFTHCRHTHTHTKHQIGYKPEISRRMKKNIFWKSVGALIDNAVCGQKGEGRGSAWPQISSGVVRARWMMMMMMMVMYR